MPAMRRPDRAALAHLPTPLQPLPRWSRRLGVELLVKRDDLTGSHLSGNKIRKLGYLLADAARRGATHIVTCGGVQSNHCRATAMAAAQLGMKATLLLRTPRGQRDELPEPPTGNVLLGRLAGADLRVCSPAGYQRRDALMAEIAADLEREPGATAYVVPEGGSNALGALGYVDAACEIVAQCGDTPPSAALCATGSGGTVAGLALGFEALGVPTRAVGVAVCDDEPTFGRIVEGIAATAATDYGLPPLSPGRFEIIGGFQGRGYALATTEELCSLADVARHDGIVLDPVYTNKAFRALTTLIAERPDRFGGRVVFVHTGGVFGLMAQAAELGRIL